MCAFPVSLNIEDLNYQFNSRTVLQIDVNFSCVCPVIDHEFRLNIVKIAVDPQTTDVYLFYDSKLSNCLLSVVDASHKL